MRTLITRSLLANGYPVIACDRRAGDADDWLAGIPQELQAGLTVRDFDVRNPDAVSALLGELSSRGQHIAYLINNAGIANVTPPWSTDVAAFDRVIQVNLYGTFLLSRACCAAMREAGFGRIINFASLAAVEPGEGMASYAAAKAGIIGYSHSLARDLAGDGVTVNVIAPGLIWHDRLAPTFTDSQRAALRQANPMGREGHPDEIAATVLFLMSEGAGYITGQTLHVNGGAYMT